MPYYAKIHFVVVHFPIALLVTATLMEWYQNWRHQVGVATSTWLAIGVVGAWVSVITGILNRNWQLSRGLLDTTELQVLAWRHLLLSISASAIFTAVLVQKLIVKGTLPRWSWLLQGAGLVLLVLSTHLGGLLAHGSS
jgi:uncharacterized membrane protein